jgi:hypothetical protein
MSTCSQLPCPARAGGRPRTTALPRCRSGSSWRPCLRGQAQGERADLRLECPGVQLPGLAGTRFLCGHSFGSLPVAHHPQPSVSAGERFQSITMTGNDPRDRTRGPRQAGRRGAGYPAGYIPADGGQRTTLGGAAPSGSTEMGAARAAALRCCRVVNCAAPHRQRERTSRSAAASVGRWGILLGQRRVPPYAAHRRFARRLSIPSGRQRQGDLTPCHF